MAITNPRFINYARAHGRAPEDQLAFDKAQFPGGCMVGFILWNKSRLVDFSKAQPSAFTCGGLTDHEAYDDWLTRWVDENATKEEV